ncbi:MAG: hypothetical protein IKR04_07230 [Clostridia bacterium]|nr:hypothetical protein [Clostridia bacterium]
MDKKSIIAIVVVGLIVVGLIIFLFVGDNTSDTILTVGKVDYSTDDFISYVRTWIKDGSYTDFDTYVETYGSSLEEGYDESDYVSSMFSAYQIYKMYSQYAQKLGVTLEDGEMPAELSSGDIEELMSEYGLSSGEYLRVQKEVTLANKFFSAPNQYLSGDDTITASYLSRNGYDPEKVYTSYKYRVVQVPVELVDADSDVSGEFSGDYSGENARRLVEATAQADALLELSKDAVTKFSGDISFEEFQSYIASKENATLDKIFADVIASGDDGFSYDIFAYISRAVPYDRYSQNGLGFKTMGNGDLDNVSALFISEDLTGSSSYAGMFSGTLYSSYVVPFITKAEDGEFSETFASDNSDYVGFAYLESSENKLTEEDQSRFDTNVLNYYIQSSIEVVPKNKAKVTSIKLADIIPSIAKKQAEKEAAALASGDVVESDDGIDDIVINPEEADITDLAVSGATE